MSSILLTPPAVEPVTLADAKAYLRVDNDDDDAVISALIAGARSHIEAQTRRALITQTWRLVRDVWPGDRRIAVVPSPLQQVTAARVYRVDGSTRALAAGLRCRPGRDAGDHLVPDVAAAAGAGAAGGRDRDRCRSRL